MLENKDKQLIEELIRATQEGKIVWHPTARPGEYTDSFLGKFGVIVAEIPRNFYSEILGSSAGSVPPELAEYELRVLDDLGGVLHRIVDPSIKPLVDSARRPPIAEEARHSNV